MTYLILGPHGEKKEAAIKQIKNKYLPQKNLLSFDYEVLYGHKLDSEDLQKALLAIPVFGDQRLVLIRECHKLNERNKTLISDFVSPGLAQGVLILEAEGLKNSDPFLKCLKSSAQIIQIEQERAANVFDVTRALSRHKKDEALKILSGLFEAGVPPLQIMGGLVWFWGECKETLPRQRFEAGLRVLQETDLNIKRSRTKPEYAIEILLVKLGTLMP